MVFERKFVFIALVVGLLATEMDISGSSSDSKVKQFLAQVRSILTDSSLLFLSIRTFRATLYVTAHAEVRGVFY